MDESLHKIDDLFYNELEGYKEAPSARSWQEIIKQLDEPQKPAAPVFSFPYLKIALILVLLVAGYALNKTVDRTGGRGQVASGREQVAGGSEQEAGGKGQVAGDRKQEAGGNGQVAEGREQEAGDREQVAEGKGQVAEGREQLAVDKKQEAGIKVQMNGDDERSLDRKKSVINKSIAVRNTDPLSATIAKDHRQNSLPEALSGNPAFRIQNSTEVLLQPDRKNGNALASSVTTRIPAQPVIPTRKPSVGLASHKKLSLSAFFSPDFTWSTISDHEEPRPGSGGGRPRENHHDISENEKPGFSYTAGTKLRMELGKHFSLETGLSYSLSDTRQEPKKLYADHDDNGEVRYRMNCSAGYTWLLPETTTAPAVGDSILMNQSNYKVQYLNIPLLAGYAFGQGKLRAGIIGGTQINVLLKGKSSAVIQQNNNSKTTVASSIQGLKKLTTDMVAGISLDYRIAPQFSLSLVPQGRFSLSPINQSGAVTSRPGAFSLSAGLRYFF